MAEMKIEADISVPDKPNVLDIPDAAWEQITKHVSIHYRQFRDEVDASFVTFMVKMLEALGKGVGPDAPTTDVRLETLFTGKRRRKRQEKNGAYVSCKWLGDKTGYSPDTIRKIFLREKAGVEKRTFSGRNRRCYTVMRISKAAAKRHFPELEI